MDLKKAAVAIGAASAIGTAGAGPAVSVPSADDAKMKGLQTCLQNADSAYKTAVDAAGNAVSTGVGALASKIPGGFGGLLKGKADDFAKDQAKNTAESTRSTAIAECNDKFGTAKPADGASAPAAASAASGAASESAKPGVFNLFKDAKDKAAGFVSGAASAVRNAAPASAPVQREP